MRAETTTAACATSTMAEIDCRRKDFYRHGGPPATPGAPSVGLVVMSRRRSEEGRMRTMTSASVPGSQALGRRKARGWWSNLHTRRLYITAAQTSVADRQRGRWVASKQTVGTAVHGQRTRSSRTNARTIDRPDRPRRRWRRPAPVGTDERRTPVARTLRRPTRGAGARRLDRLISNHRRNQPQSG